MSTFFISVVLPHQLSANWTRIGHVAHELQPYYKTWLKLLDFFALHINVTQEDFCLANKFPEASTFAGPSMCLPIVIMKDLLDFYLPGNPICIKEGVSKQYTTLQECETNFVQGINFFFFFVAKRSVQ